MKYTGEEDMDNMTEKTGPIQFDWRGYDCQIQILDEFNRTKTEVVKNEYYRYWVVNPDGELVQTGRYKREDTDVEHVKVMTKNIVDSELAKQTIETTDN